MGKYYYSTVPGIYSLSTLLGEVFDALWDDPRDQLHLANPVHSFLFSVPSIPRSYIPLDVGSFFPQEISKDSISQFHPFNFIWDFSPHFSDSND